jgi:hypothetical protein
VTFTSAPSTHRDIRQDLAGDGPHGLHTLARTVLKDSGFDRNAAAHSLAAQIREDSQLVMFATERVARDLIRMAEFTHRGNLGRPPANSDAGLEGLRSRLQEAQSIFDSFSLPIPSGVHLGDASLSDLQEAMELHAHNEAGHRNRRKFYTAVAERTADQKRVRDCWNEGDLLALWRKFSC